MIKSAHRLASSPSPFVRLAAASTFPGAWPVHSATSGGRGECPAPGAPAVLRIHAMAPLLAPALQRAPRAPLRSTRATAKPGRPVGSPACSRQLLGRARVLVALAFPDQGPGA
eukprot:8820366-Pyramimonas_sp.AAC.1